MHRICWHPVLRFRWYGPCVSSSALGSLFVRVKLILHCSDNVYVIFDGPSSECPPIPRVGDQIECEGKMYHLEGIQHSYTEEVVTINLLA